MTGLREFCQIYCILTFVTFDLSNRTLLRTKQTIVLDSFTSVHTF